MYENTPLTLEQRARLERAEYLVSLVFDAAGTIGAFFKRHMSPGRTGQRLTSQ